MSDLCVSRLAETRREKEVLLQNRHYRDQQYAERRSKDYRESLAREHQLSLQLREDYVRQADSLKLQHGDIMAAKKAERVKKHTVICASIINQVFDLSMTVI